MPRRPRYSRRPPTRRSKPTILIATEGKETEPIYFDELKDRHRDVVTVLVSPGKVGQSNPLRVLRRLREAIGKRASWQRRDRAWMVVDTDCWTDEEKREVVREIAGDGRLHLAASNPCFELWLVLHFRAGWSAVTSGELEALLRSPECLGSFSKENYDAAALMDRVQAAVKRAKSAATTPLEQWVSAGETHVYRVVEEIIKLG